MAEISIGLIFLAGGKGARFGSPKPKQFIELMGKPLALYSLETLLKLPFIKECIIVCEEEFRSSFNPYSSSITSFAKPGSERQFSMISGFEKLSRKNSHVLVHDAARPLVSLKDATKLILEGASFPAATLATPIRSTIKLADTHQCVISTLDRHKLWDIQTPQLLQYQILHEGIQQMNSHPFPVTDDVSIAEYLGYQVKLIQGSPHNIKVTEPFDAHFASFYLNQRKDAPAYASL